MPQSNFQAQVSARVAQIKGAREAVYKESAQRTIAVMQEPGPSVATVKAAISKGAGLGKTKKDGSRGVSKRTFGPIGNPGGAGNLPVDTGFLRASLAVVIGEAFPALADNPTSPTAKSYDDGAVNLVISGAEITDPILAVYTARYARRMEYGFSGTDSLGRQYNQSGRRFVGLAAQQWQRIVNQVCAEVKGRAK